MKGHGYCCTSNFYFHLNRGQNSSTAFGEMEARHSIRLGIAVSHIISRKGRCCVIQCSSPPLVQYNPKCEAGIPPLPKSGGLEGHGAECLPRPQRHKGRLWLHPRRPAQLLLTRPVRCSRRRFLVHEARRSVRVHLEMLWTSAPYALERVKGSSMVAFYAPYVATNAS